MVDALEPWDPREVLGHEYDDELRTALTLRAETAGVINAGATEPRLGKRPALIYALDVAAQGTVIDLR